MAITFFDGFDLYGSTTTMLAQWANNGSPVITTTGGRFGGGGAICDGSANESIYRVDVLNNNFVTVGFAFKTDLVDPTRIFTWNRLAGSTLTSVINGSIFLNTDGSVVIEGAGGADMGTSATGVVVAGQWFYMEVQIFRNNTTGSIEAFIGGSSIVSATSVDTEATTAAGSFMWGSSDSATEVVFDDIYLAQDASSLPATLGDVKVSTLLPNADTAQADWTPLSGTGFSNIDDALGTDGDANTSYISETTLNGKSEFDLEALPETPIAIHSVSIATRATKTDSGSIEYKHHVDSNGTEATSVAIAPSETNYNMTFSYHNTDPDTASAWTESGVNAMKLGVEVTA